MEFHHHALYCFVLYLFRLPNDDTREKWIDVIGKLQQMTLSTGYFFVCSNHFNKEQFETKNGNTTLRNGSIPSKFEPKQGVTHEIHPVSIPEQCDEYDRLGENLHLSRKIQALEQVNIRLKGDVRSLRMKLADQAKELHTLQKQHDSQQKTISELKQKNSDMEAGQLHGFVSVPYFKITILVLVREKSDIFFSKILAE